jgi:Domain of unknown function (DUF4157)
MGGSRGEGSGSSRQRHDRGPAAGRSPSVAAGQSMTELVAQRGRVGGERNTAPTNEVFFSKAPARSNRDVLDKGPGTPMTLEHVHETAHRVGIDLRDVEVVIISDPEEIRYLDHMDAGAYTPSELDGSQIRLGPASFADEESLAATIAHEHTHVQQQRAGEHLYRPLRELEDQAYDSEIPALERLRNSTQ